MKVQEWQDQFLTLIYGDKSNNIFPASLIKMVATASDEDTEKFKAFITSYFKQYESTTISVLGKNSPMRELILSIGSSEEPEVEEEEEEEELP